jgi:hypothetical protein
MTTPQTQSPPPLPPTMPVLTGRDICRLYNDGPDGTHCLLGWKTAVIGREVNAANFAVYHALHDACGGSVADFNDDTHNNTREQVAGKWNDAMRALGYVLSPDKSHFILPTPTTGEETQRG